MATDPLRGDVYDEIIITPAGGSAGADASPLADAASSASVAPVGDGPGVERRMNRVDDASDLDEDAAIDPRELDAMVRIQEGATVDEDAPVAGVRYEGDETTPHRYGQPEDAYGPGHGDGRIGFDKVVGDVDGGADDRA